MKKLQVATWLQNKMFLAALLMVLVAGTALAGVLALGRGDGGEQEETKPGYAFQTEEDDQVGGQLLEQPQNQHEMTPENDLKIQEPAEDIQKEQPVQSDKVDMVSRDDHSVKEDPDEMADLQGEAETLVSGDTAVIYEPESEEEAAAVPMAPLEFHADSTMAWPVFGNIVLDYSMDTTIYFPTLEQYKCNPGMLIQAEVGQPVMAAVRGQVTAIGVDEELGNFIMMDLGGDYTLRYGQLESIAVSVGQIVEEGELLGVVAQPTKYYVVEGPNIYLEMRYQQEPVDPLDHIR